MMAVDFTYAIGLASHRFPPLFGSQVSFFCESSAQSTGQNYGFHQYKLGDVDDFKTSNRMSSWAIDCLTITAINDSAYLEQIYSKVFLRLAKDLSRG